MSPPIHSDPTCIFCKIVAGQIPCFKVYEDDLVLSFLDIGPLTKGHTLVIPKSHYVTVIEAPAEVLAAVTARIPSIARAVLAATGHSAFNLLANNGKDAQQSVGHLHFHILPRFSGDGFHVPWPAGKLETSEGARLVEAVRKQLGA